MEELTGEGSRRRRSATAREAIICEGKLKCLRQRGDENQQHDQAGNEGSGHYRINLALGKKCNGANVVSRIRIRMDQFMERGADADQGYGNYQRTQQEGRG